MITVGTTIKNMAAVIRRFRPSDVGEHAGERRGQRDRAGAGGHQRGNLAGADVEFARELRQQRLRRIQIDEGAEAGGGDGEQAGIEGHSVIMREARGHLASSIARHTRYGVHGVSMWRMPSTDKRIDDGVDAGGQRADGAGFAGAFYSQRIGRRRHRIVLDHHRAKVVRPRHGVIHERAGEHLAGVVIGFVFHQHLAHALGDAAHDLALDQHRIDDGADVVDHPIADHLVTPVSGSISTSQTWQPLGKFPVRAR